MKNKMLAFEVAALSVMFVAGLLCGQKVADNSAKLAMSDVSKYDFDPGYATAEPVVKIPNVQETKKVAVDTKVATKTAVKADTKTKKTVKDAAVEESCDYDTSAEGFQPEYKAQIVTVRQQFRHDLGEQFRVKVYVKNAGNVPWFSPDSKCADAGRVYVGTTREKDRDSVFYSPGIEKDDNGWVSASRIRMDKGLLRVDPGQIASFTFWAEADDQPSVYREYFEPVVDGTMWLDDAEFKVDIYSGKTEDTAQSLRKKLMYAYKSSNINDIPSDGERVVEVDLSDQKLYLKIDDYVVRTFIVSSGAADTPTPVGTFAIKEKNDIRIGAKPPHYIMPKFQRFTPQGAALHALPSLGNDGGVFWTEAKSHLGTPVSHGCVRMSPEDADYAYEFTEVGDNIVIHW